MLDEQIPDTEEIHIVSKQGDAEIILIWDDTLKYYIGNSVTEVSIIMSLYPDDSIFCFGIYFLPVTLIYYDFNTLETEE